MPYKGTGPATQALVAGEIDWMFEALGSAAGQIRAGTVRPIVVTSAKRSPAFPDVPTAIESASPASRSRRGTAVGAGGTPRGDRAKLHNAVVKAFADPELKDTWAKLGAEPGGSSPEAFRALIDKDVAKWGKVVREAKRSPSTRRDDIAMQRRILLPTGRDGPPSMALVAAVCGCSSLQSPRDPPRGTSPPATRPRPARRTTCRRRKTIARANPQISPAVARAIEHVLRQPSDHPRAAVLDFSAHSATPRFHLVDRASGRVLQTFRVAHGQGSEGSRKDGHAEVFSNVPDSNASSLGLYRTAETYVSEAYPGLAMRMDGLSPTNSNARSRYIVIHAARYMEPESWEGKQGGAARAERRVLRVLERRPRRRRCRVCKAAR